MELNEYTVILVLYVGAVMGVLIDFPGKPLLVEPDVETVFGRILGSAGTKNRCWQEYARHKYLL